ncbi:MAG TPA: hypothetical protein VGI83_02700 [Gemmatimonadales bacterium]
MKRLAALVLGLTAAGACSRGPVKVQHVSVTVEPGFVQLTHAGDHVPFLARAFDPARAAVGDARFVWRSSDTTVATVKDGVVSAQKDGIARIWAVSGADSSFAVAVVQLARVVTLTLQPALAHFDAVGDTTTLALMNPDSLVSPRPMCLADDDHIAVIDTTFRVHTVGNGTTLIRCRSGDAEGSMRVIVQQRIARVGIVTGVTRTLRMERDTIHLALAKVDKQNTPMDVGTPTWRSLDTSVVSVDQSTGAAVGRGEGTGRVVATLGGLADTTLLEIIPKEPVFAAARPMLRVTGPGLGLRGTRGAPGGGGARGTTLVGPRPVSTLVNAREIIESDSIFQAQTMIPGQADSHLRLALTVVTTDYKTAAEGTGSVVDTRTGIMYGGQIEFMPSPKFDLRFDGAYAPSLKGPVGVAELQASNATLDVGLGVLPWLLLQVGGGFRSYYGLALRNSQWWLSFRAGAEARFDIGGSAQGVIGATAMPFIAGNPSFATGNPSGVSGFAGLDYHTGRFLFGARYELERYAFPGDDTSRKEQFATLKFRLGMNLGQ